MSKPTGEELSPLREVRGDDGAYHARFDELLAAKLRKLDPEWMAEMDTEYAESGMSRWCA